MYPSSHPVHTGIGSYPEDNKMVQKIDRFFKVCTIKEYWLSLLLQSMQVTTVKCTSKMSLIVAGYNANVAWVTQVDLAARALCRFLPHSQCPALTVDFEAAGSVRHLVLCCRSHSHCTSYPAHGKALCSGLGSHYI